MKVLLKHNECRKYTHVQVGCLIASLSWLGRQRQEVLSKLPILRIGCPKVELKWIDLSLNLVEMDIFWGYVCAI